MSSRDAKQAAAERAAGLVESGMRLGLGTGSTAALLVEAVGRRVRDGLDIVAVPTSEATRRQAAGLGIRLASLDEMPELDLTIDGADEIDPALRLIKGGGGALLSEKLVASASRRMVVIADGSKRVDRLGRVPLPIEVVALGWETTRRRVASLLREAGYADDLALRPGPGGGPLTTDHGHHILDARLGAIADPEGLGRALKAVLGVVEHGLFVGLASSALIGTQDGVMEIAAGSRSGPTGDRPACG